MTNIIKLDINNIGIEKFTKLLSKLQDSEYTIWEGRVLRHQTKEKNYSYENLLNIFKNLKEMPDADADKLEHLRSKLLKLDKPATNSLSQKIKEFFHAVVSHFKGTHIDKDDILDTWMVQDSDENQEPETQNETQNETENTDTQEEKIDRNEITPEIIPVVITDETEINDICDLDDEESSLSEEELLDDKTNDFAESDQLNQDDLGTEKHDQTEPEIVPVENNQETTDETTVIDEPKPLVDIPEVSVEEPAVGPLVLPETETPAQGYTKWHLLGVGVVTFVATIIFNKLVSSQLPGGEMPQVPNSVTCDPVPNDLADHKVTYDKLCTLSQDNKPFFNAVNSGFQELEKLKVTNNELKWTNGKLKAEFIQTTDNLDKLRAKFDDLSEGTKGWNHPLVLSDLKTNLFLNLETDPSAEQIEKIKHALHDVTEHIAKNKDISVGALSNEAINLVEEAVKKYIIAKDSSLQLKALEALFALYDKKGYVIKADFELHTLFAPFITTHKIGKANLDQLTLLIRNAKFASDEIKKKTIKNFIMKLNLHADLVDENQVKFFDDLLQEHFVLQGDVRSALTTPHELMAQGKKTRAFAILDNMLNGFDQQSKENQVHISNGMLGVVKGLDDFNLINKLFEKCESLDAIVEDALLGTLKEISVGEDDALGNLHILLKHLKRMQATNAYDTISKQTLAKIKIILEDKTVVSSKKVAILNEFVKGFDSLRVELEYELVSLTKMVASKEIDWTQGAPLLLLDNLLRLKSFGPFFQIPDTLLDIDPSVKGKIIFMMEKFVKENGHSRTKDLDEGQKLHAATLVAKVANKGVSPGELRKISAISKELQVPKLTEKQKASLIDKYKDVFITDYTLQTYVNQHSVADAEAMKDYLIYSPFEDTNKRLPEFAKLLLEIGTKNWVSAISASDYEKHGFALDILGDLVSGIVDEEGKALLERALKQVSKEAKEIEKSKPEISKGLYPRSIKLRLTMLQNDPTEKLLEKSREHIGPMLFDEFAKKYPVELRVQAFKDYAAIFEVLLINGHAPGLDPLVKYFENPNEIIDVVIARSLLNIAINDKYKNFPKKINKYSGSILNRVEKDLNASPFEKMSVYVEYYGAAKAGVEQIVNLYKAEVRNPSKDIGKMVDILDRTITPTVAKEDWQSMSDVLAGLKTVVSINQRHVIEAIENRLKI